MREYRTSMGVCAQSDFVELGEDANLLELILGDAKPVVSSATDVRYDIASRPTELSSGGYVDITDITD